MQNNMFHVNRLSFWPGNNAMELSWNSGLLTLLSWEIETKLYKIIQFELLYGEIVSAH